MKIEKNITNLGKRVAEQIKKSGVSPYRIATHARIPFNTLYKMLAGKRSNITIETLLRLCATLECSPSTLLSWEEKK